MTAPFAPPVILTGGGPIITPPLTADAATIYCSHCEANYPAALALACRKPTCPAKRSTI